MIRALSQSLQRLPCQFPSLLDEIPIKVVGRLGGYGFLTPPATERAFSSSIRRASRIVSHHEVSLLDADRRKVLGTGPTSPRSAAPE